MANASHVAGLIPPARGSDCVLVAIDGYDGSGKTTFADALAVSLRTLGRPVVRVSIDDFHNVAAARHRRGRWSPLGFWLDSYDYDAFRRDVLVPLGPGGDRSYRAACHSLVDDSVVTPARESAPAGAVVVVDGIFLHRSELVSAWHFSVWLEVPVDVSIARLAMRDGSPADPLDPANARYVGGQQLYVAACKPWSRASVVVPNG